MYLVKPLSRDKESGRYTMYLPDPLSRERDFTRYMDNPETHIGLNTGLGVPKFCGIEVA